MSWPETYIIRAITADKYTLTIDYKDAAGNPVDLTGETISCKFYSDDTLLFTLTSGTGLTITPVTGRIVIDLTSSQTTQLDGKRNRRYTLRLDTSEKTILTGDVEVMNV